MASEVMMTSVMMDRFEPIKGVGVWACNIKKLDMENVTITGSSTKEPILKNVETTLFEGVNYK